MASITFDELINRLPIAMRLPLGQSAPPAVKEPDHKPFFVAPTITSVWQSELKPSVVLVSARGAVGKTTFAGELASMTGAHLWPLGKFQVGHQFLEGGASDGLRRRIIFAGCARIARGEASCGSRRS